MPRSTKATKKTSPPHKRGTGADARPSADDRAPWLGVWLPAEAGESNLSVTVTAGRGEGLKVAAQDAIDGEELEVSKVRWEGKSLHFRTLTPSTGVTLDHQLELRPRAEAVYRCTVAQSWVRTPLLASALPSRRRPRG